MRFTSVTVALCAISATVSAHRYPRPSHFEKPWLNTLAQQAGKLWFGTASDIPGVEQQNKEYMEILQDNRIFGQLTPANSMKVSY